MHTNYNKELGKNCPAYNDKNQTFIENPSDYYITKYNSFYK